MNSAHIHLMINHLSLFTTLMGIVILIYTIISKNKNYEKLYLLLFIISVLSIVPTYFSGDGAEEIIEDIKGISKSLIHSHEEMGEKTLIATMFLGFVSLGKLLIKNNEKLTKTMFYLIIISSIVSFGLISNTAYLGGQIRHTELTNGSNIYENNEKEDKD